MANLEREAREELEKAAPLISSFTKLARTSGVELGPHSFSYCATVGVTAEAPKLALKLLGNPAIERDGLLSFDDLAKAYPPPPRVEGYFAGQQFILMAHPCFRRRMHPLANWAPRFIEQFWGFNAPYLRKYIALDQDRVRIDVNGGGYFEFDTWYGAPFNEDVAKIKPGVVKLRPPPTLSPHHLEFFFASTYSLDIKWSGADGIKTFQALEMKTEDFHVKLDGEVYYPARYLHAEFDISLMRFRHFDGAIQYFTRNEYLQRRDADFNMTAKNADHIKARSKKVFKINGPLDTKDWVNFCCHFFTANPLTFEYFTGSYPPHVNDGLEKLARLDDTRNE